MRGRYRIVLALAALLAIAGGLSVDWRFGDSRWGFAGEALRGWHLASNSLALVRPACAQFDETGGGPCGGSAGATSYTMTGPSSGTIGQASMNFTLTPNGNSSATVTPSDSSHHGLFVPTAPAFSGSGAKTFTYEPLQAGSWNISATNSGSLTNPPAIAFSVSNLVTGYPGMTTCWIPAFGVPSITTGVSGDPFGGANAASITEDTSTGAHDIYCGPITVSSGESFVVSLMIKQGTGTRNVAINLVENSGFASALYTVFNPSTCTFLQDYTYGTAALSSTNVSTTGLASGWCLVQESGTVGAYTSLNYQVQMMSGVNDSYAGDGASTVDLYGPVVQ